MAGGNIISKRANVSFTVTVRTKHANGDKAPGEN